MNFQLIIDSLTKIVTDIINFIPNLINGLIILVVGFDPLVERTGITGSLRGLGVTVPISTILAQTVFAFLLMSFFITATRLMSLEAVARLLEQILGFLPNALAALIVFLLGGTVAQFMGGLVAGLASAAGLSYGARLGRLIQYISSVFVAIIALNVLGLDTALLVTAVTLLIAAFGLAVGLALGLGARPVVHHLMAGYYLRQRFPVGQPVIVEATEGEVSAIGGVNTLVATATGSIVIPNGLLLESLVRLPERPASGEQDAPGPAAG
jgi:small-conductance mechanosensitive channel